MRLTVNERAFYDENGYVLKKGSISTDWIEEILGEIERLHEQMAEYAPKEVAVSWEEFEDPNLPKRIRSSWLLPPPISRDVICTLMVDLSLMQFRDK